MLFAAMFVICAAFLLIGYKVYGRFMSNLYGLDDTRATPAHRLQDDIDYCPGHPAVLLGHHFASIAGAGPITGPIFAAMTWGWLPTLLWCMLGSVFLGGPHDMGSLVSSMNHDGKSIGAIIERWIGKPGKFLFLAFTIITLILVVAVFLVMSVGTFVNDPVVAFVSCLYILLAIITGLLIYKVHTPLWLVTVVMLAIIAYACLCVNKDTWPNLIGWFTFKDTVADGKVVTAAAAKATSFWTWTLSVYILAASVLPVWLMLQPRDYLASYFLYFAVVVGAIGMLFGSHLNSGTVPLYVASAPVIDVALNGKAMWPMLFVTVACGAISGFHSLVGSGTTSKQIDKETDAVLVGYGAMLLEGLVAVISVGTLMALGLAGAKGLNPVIIFSKGFGMFAGIIGIKPELGTRLGALAINGFLLTSLDTATRLTRYQIQEFCGPWMNKWVATFIAIGAALVMVFTKTHDPDGKEIATWAAIWPLFGAANQQVAALSLLGIGVWVKKGLNKNATFLLAPFWFMLLTTLGALCIMVKTKIFAVHPNYLLGGVAIVLIVLAIGMVINGLSALNRPAKQEEPTK